MGFISYLGRFTGVVIAGFLVLVFFLASGRAMTVGQDLAGGVFLVIAFVLVALILYLRKGL